MVGLDEVLLIAPFLRKWCDHSMRPFSSKVGFVEASSVWGLLYTGEFLI